MGLYSRFFCKNLGFFGKLGSGPKWGAGLILEVGLFTGRYGTTKITKKYIYMFLGFKGNTTLKFELPSSKIEKVKNFGYF